MFPVTRSSILERVKQGGEAGRQALGDWFVAYRPAIHWFIRSRFRQLAPEADEVLAEFVKQKVLEGTLLKGYSPEPGRMFRSLLWVALNRFCIQVLRAKERRMTTCVFDEDFDSPYAPESDGADVLWARQVLGRAIRRMKRDCEQASKTKLRVWGVFKARFLGPLRGKPETPYPELVARYGYSAPKIAQNDAGDGKKMFAQALLAVVSEYTGSDDARSELNDLWRIAKDINRSRRSQEPEPESPEEGVDHDA